MDKSSLQKYVFAHLSLLCKEIANKKIILTDSEFSYSSPEEQLFILEEFNRIGDNLFSKAGEYQKIIQQAKEKRIAKNITIDQIEKIDTEGAYCGPSCPYYNAIPAGTFCKLFKSRLFAHGPTFTEFKIKRCQDCLKIDI
jgi:hypothetical protein